MPWLRFQVSGGRRSPARWHPMHGAPKREQVKSSAEYALGSFWVNIAVPNRW